MAARSAAFEEKAKKTKQQVVSSEGCRVLGSYILHFVDFLCGLGSFAFERVYQGPENEAHPV